MDIKSKSYTNVQPLKREDDRKNIQSFEQQSGLQNIQERGKNEIKIETIDIKEEDVEDGHLFHQIFLLDENQSGMKTRNNFAIVKLIEENGYLVVVALNWVHKSKKFCYFPNVCSKMAKDRLLRKRVVPDKNWFMCPIEFVQEYESHADARLHLSFLKKAEDKSYSESDDNEEDKLIGKRMEQDVIILPADSGETQSPNSQKRKNINSEEDVSSRLPPSSKLKVDNPCPSNSYLPNSVPVQIDITDEDSSPQPCLATERLSELTTPVINPSSSSDEFTKRILIQQGQMMSMISDVLSSINRLEKKVDGMLTHQTIPPNLDSSVCDEEYSLLSSSLPVENEEKFIAFNEKLKNNAESRKQLVNLLSSIGGKDYRSLVNNMLRRLLLDEVAELYSLTGKILKNSHKKKAFVSTKVYQIIFYVCRRFFPDTTEEQFKQILGDWLNQAKVRRSRKDQRNQKTNTEEIKPELYFGE